MEPMFSCVALKLCDCFVFGNHEFCLFCCVSENDSLLPSMKRICSSRSSSSGKSSSYGYSPMKVSGLYCLLYFSKQYIVIIFIQNSVQL